MERPTPREAGPKGRSGLPTANLLSLVSSDPFLTSRNGNLRYSLWTKLLWICYIILRKTFGLREACVLEFNAFSLLGAVIAVHRLIPLRALV